MPKATMHENDATPSAKDKIGLSWKIADVKTVAVPHGMNEAAHDPFGRGVASTYPSHPFASFGLGQGVHHRVIMPVLVHGRGGEVRTEVV
ncbi:hypothetical protein ROR02_07380 [Pararhodospirillum oryzae]|uniref:Uncharacterized protein n=1 Tax=Pararhodospirillum oryzae TaxID=478448 RepID=A0A512H597_9PROT|nr:hypothetical protein ROR02_07380 [Pararhodospirillum oryzae]